MSSSLPAVDAGPFDLQPDAEHAVLCLHGLTGTPYEVRSVGEALAAVGLRARGPLLPGHGGAPRELARTRHAAWLDAARREVEALRQRHGRVSVVGLSMGGVLTLALASEERVAAAAVIGTPLRLPTPIRQLVPWVKWLRPYLAKSTGADIQDPEARARHPSMAAMPLHAVHELVRLQRLVGARLHRIRAPLLVAHGVHDRTARPRDAEELARRVPGAELLWLERSGHVVPVDHDRVELAEAVVRFVTRSADG